MTARLAIIRIPSGRSGLALQQLGRLMDRVSLVAASHLGWLRRLCRVQTCFRARYRQEGAGYSRAGWFPVQICLFESTHAFFAGWLTSTKTEMPVPCDSVKDLQDRGPRGAAYGWERSSALCLQMARPGPFRHLVFVLLGGASGRWTSRSVQDLQWLFSAFWSGQRFMGPRAMARSRCKRGQAKQGIESPKAPVGCLHMKMRITNKVSRLYAQHLFARQARLQRRSSQVSRCSAAHHSTVL